MTLQPHLEYSPSYIARNGWIRNTIGKTDYRYILRLIKQGRLRARNACLTGGKQFKVRGEEILRFRTIQDKKLFKGNAEEPAKGSNHTE